jgi:hypothetical protein
MLKDYDGLIKKVAKANKILVLENEHDCYVALIDDIHRIMNHFKSPHIRWLFDTGICLCALKNLHRKIT